MLLQWH